VRQVTREEGIEEHFKLAGRECCLLYATLDAACQPSQSFRTLFLQEIMKRGVLAPSFVVGYSHTDADIDQTISVVADALKVYRRALEDGVERYLVGRPVKPVFRKFS
jgi:glutamate-1-semialdehyde 2,1-aminomutase